MKLVENSDFDHGHRDAAKLHKFDGRGAAGTPAEEFSDRGRADLKVKRNDPRFADNPMKKDDLDENDIDHADNGRILIDPTNTERLHAMLNKAGISDQELKGATGDHLLTHRGKHIVAARLGISPEDVRLMINSLIQHLRDEQGEKETLAEQYRKLLKEADIPAQPPFPERRPIEAKARYTIEPDALGNATVMDTRTGQSKFLRGGQATSVLDKLKTDGNKDAVLAPIFERAANPEAEHSYQQEIAATSGTYNFPWHLHGRRGLATAFFDAKQPMALHVESIRDLDGEEVELDDNTRQEILQQARDFIGHE